MVETNLIEEKFSMTNSAHCSDSIDLDTDNCSALTPSNVTTLPEWVNEDIVINTYIEVGLSILVLITGAITAATIEYKFPKSFVFRVIQIDCIVSSVCQLGIIASLLSSITEEPNILICSVASALSGFSIYHFAWSGLSIAIAR